MLKNYSVGKGASRAVKASIASPSASVPSGVALASAPVPSGVTLVSAPASGTGTGRNRLYALSS